MGVVTNFESTPHHSCSTSTCSQEKSGLNRTLTSGLQQWSLRPWHPQRLSLPSQDQLENQPSSCHQSPWLLGFWLNFLGLCKGFFGGFFGLRQGFLHAKLFLALLRYRWAGLDQPPPTQLLSWPPHKRSGPSHSLWTYHVSWGHPVLPSHAWEKLLCLIFAPHQKVEGRILFKKSLDLEVLHFPDFFLDLIFLRYVGDRWWLT